MKCYTIQDGMIVFSISYVEFNLNYVIPHMDDQKAINYLLTNPGDEVSILK